MTIFGRAPVPPSPADTPAGRLAALNARVAQAVARVDEGLRASGTNRQLTDVLLDLRLLLRPPRQP